MNGTSGAVAQVKGGQSLDITLSVSIGSCGPFGAKQFYLGIDAASTAAQYQSRPCSSFADIVLDLPFSITAPSETGLHYVLAGLGNSMTFTCNSSPSAVDTLEGRVSRNDVP